jgi:hypothetical protein
MEVLVVIVLGGLLFYLINKANKHWEKQAPNCCGKSMKHTGGGSYGGKYGRGGSYWKCSECGRTEITYK